MLRISALLLCLLTACGPAAMPSAPTLPPEVMPDPVPTPDPLPAPDPEAKKVIVAVWGAPWCSACKSVLPKVEKELDSLEPEARAGIDFRLYVPSGKSSGSRPTNEIALAYKSSLGLSATAYVDPWRWSLFSHYFGSDLAIPAGAILRMDGSMIRSYPPGRLDPADMVAHAKKEALK